MRFLSPVWRPNSTGPAPMDRDDRDLVRQYAELPATSLVSQIITLQMNNTADLWPGAVARIQSWIDEIEDLEADYSGKVADGTAFLGNVDEYEGLRPGYSPSRQELLKKADIAEWDVETLARVRIKTGRSGGIGTATGVMNDRIQDLKGRVLAALDLNGTISIDGSRFVERS